MAHREHGNAVDDAMELLIENGFDRMADVLRILLNEAMKIEREDTLAARSYQRTSDRKGYANGYKPKTVDTRCPKTSKGFPVPPFGTTPNMSFCSILPISAS